MLTEDNRTDAWERSPGMIALVAMALLLVLTIPFAMMIGVADAVANAVRR